MTYRALSLILIFPFIYSCQSLKKWKFFHEQKYAMAEDSYSFFSDKFKQLPAKKYPQDWFSYFYFKAERISYEKDTTIVFLEDSIAVKKYNITSRFKFQELHGVGAAPNGISKNKYTVPVYFGDDFKDVQMLKLYKNIANPQHRNMAIDVLAVGSNRVIEFRYDEFFGFAYKNQILFHPHPQELISFRVVNCGIFGDAVSVFHFGMCIHDFGFFMMEAENFDQYRLNEEDVRKLYEEYKE